MNIIIRENIENYMKELKNWILETSDCTLEEMGDFFTARVDHYEEHMEIWKKAYCKFAEILPEGCKNILDLGCGTGLELNEIWKIYPEITVVGIDLCQSMLDKLLEKHSDKALDIVCMDYFQYNMGIDKWDAIISFESLHHFLPKQKKILYKKIYSALKKDAAFIVGDYIACCIEEEEILRNVYWEKRRKFEIPENQFVHFDIPLTLEHEITLLQESGFSNIEVADSIEGATLMIAKK